MKMDSESRIAFIEQFKNRTKRFVIENIKFCRTLPKTDEARIIARQLITSSSSVGANYRAACRARSRAEFHSKLSIVVEEADESVFWMEILIEAEIATKLQLEYLMSEGQEILKVVSSARKNLSK